MLMIMMNVEDDDNDVDNVDEYFSFLRHDNGREVV